MPFRARVKRVLGRSDSQSDSGSLKQVKSNKSNRSFKFGQPKENHTVYGPNEKVPDSRFLGPVEPSHRERLEAFSFIDSLRRKSGQSQYSPRGSRMPSRNNSTVAPKKMSKDIAPEDKVSEHSDDSADVANVGGAARAHRAKADKQTAGHPLQHEAVPAAPEGSEERPEAGADGRPFTEAELSEALQKTKLDDHDAGAGAQAEAPV